MGQKVSCATTATEICPHGALVVNFNGQAEEFPTAVKVKRVLSYQSDSHFVCRWKDLKLHLHAVSPLTEEEELREGEIYIVLPMSVLDSDVSPRNLVALCNRLLTAAKTKAPKNRSKQARADDANMGSTSSSYKICDKLMGSCENQEVQIAYREHVQLLEKTRSWKPRLHTIQESSLVR